MGFSPSIKTSRNATPLSNLTHAVALRARSGTFLITSCRYSLMVLRGNTILWLTPHIPVRNSLPVVILLPILLFTHTNALPHKKITCSFRKSHETWESNDSHKPVTKVFPLCWEPQKSQHCCFLRNRSCQQPASRSSPLALNIVHIILYRYM